MKPEVLIDIKSGGGRILYCRAVSVERSTSLFWANSIWMKMIYLSSVNMNGTV